MIAPVELEFSKRSWSKASAWFSVIRGKPIIVEHEGWIFSTRLHDWRKQHDTQDANEGGYWSYIAMRLELIAVPIDAKFVQPPVQFGAYRWATWRDYDGRLCEGIELDDGITDPHQS